MIRGILHHCQKAILERHQPRALPQSSAKTNHVLITSRICKQWKSSRFLFPVRRRERLGQQPSFCVLNTKNESGLQIMSLDAYASETNELGYIYLFSDLYLVKNTSCIFKPLERLHIKIFKNIIPAYTSNVVRQIRSSDTWQRALLFAFSGWAVFLKSMGCCVAFMLLLKLCFYKIWVKTGDFPVLIGNKNRLTKFRIKIWRVGKWSPVPGCSKLG